MIFIVTGMHRSGTSMVAGLLHCNGVSMGSHFRKALPENPKGFYEEEAFRILNDELLKEVGYVVKEWSPHFDGIIASAQSQAAAVALIEQFNRASGMWGWKDPRTCLTLGFWLNAIDSANLLDATKVIVIDRQILSVARSLYRRGNVSSLSQGDVLCRMYREHLERSLSSYGARLNVIRLEYERLVNGLDLERLESFCGLELRNAFIDPSLDHSREGCGCVPE